jgi:hypothetical protein
MYRWRVYPTILEEPVNKSDKKNRRKKNWSKRIEKNKIGQVA